MRRNLNGLAMAALLLRELHDDSKVDTDRRVRVRVSQP